MCVLLTARTKWHKTTTHRSNRLWGLLLYTIDNDGVRKEIEIESLTPDNRKKKFNFVTWPHQFIFIFWLILVMNGKSVVRDSRLNTKKNAFLFQFAMNYHFSLTWAWNVVWQNVVIINRYVVGSSPFHLYMQLRWKPNAVDLTQLHGSFHEHFIDKFVQNLISPPICGAN